jgi:hypothetical protein
VDEGAGKASVLNGADERWCSGRKRESMANNRTPQALAVLRHGGTVEVFRCKVCSATLWPQIAGTCRFAVATRT